MITLTVEAFNLKLQANSSTMTSSKQGSKLQCRSFKRTQSSAHIKCFRFNRGGEFASCDSLNIFESKGTQQQVTTSTSEHWHYSMMVWPGCSATGFSNACVPYLTV